MKKGFVIVLAHLVFFSQGALAIHAHQRCEDEQLAGEKAEGRRLWAKKCGHIDDEDYRYMLKNDVYPVFKEKNAPTEMPAACENLTFAIICKSGCFRGDQQALFSEGFIAIEEAYERNLSSLLALGEETKRDPLVFEEQEIGSYVKSSETSVEDLIKIKTEDGQELVVTNNHPMVLEDGFIVDAKKLHKGQKLLHYAGHGTAITSLNSLRKVKGKVWNVSMKSDKPFHNVIVVEELVTGSAKFQNRWGDDHAFRLSLRNKMANLIKE